MIQIKAAERPCRYFSVVMRRRADGEPFKRMGIQEANQIASETWPTDPRHHLGDSELNQSWKDGRPRVTPRAGTAVSTVPLNISSVVGGLL